MSVSRLAVAAVVRDRRRYVTAHDATDVLHSVLNYRIALNIGVVVLSPVLNHAVRRDHRRLNEVNVWPEYHRSGIWRPDSVDPAYVDPTGRNMCGRRVRRRDWLSWHSAVFPRGPCRPDRHERRGYYSTNNDEKYKHNAARAYSRWPLSAALRHPKPFDVRKAG